MKGITIQLDYDALVQLFGTGDGEVNLEIKKGIAQTFAAKHLKGLLQDGNIRQLEHQLKSQIVAIQAAVWDRMKALVEQEVGTLTRGGTWNTPSTVTLRPEFDQKLREFARQYADEAIQKHRLQLSAHVDNELARIDSMMQARIDKTIERLVDERFEQRVQTEITRRIAALAGA